MTVKVIRANYAFNNQRVLESFNDMGDAVDYASKLANNRMPMHIDKFTFMWEIEDGDVIFTEMENFYQFHIGSIVQSDNNNSQYRFYEAKVIDCFANGFFPMYMVRLQDDTTRIVREKDIRIQRL